MSEHRSSPQWLNAPLFQYKTLQAFRSLYPCICTAQKEVSLPTAGGGTLRIERFKPFWTASFESPPCCLNTCRCGRPHHREQPPHTWQGNLRATWCKTMCKLNTLWGVHSKCYTCIRQNCKLKLRFRSFQNFGLTMPPFALNFSKILQDSSRNSTKAKRSLGSLAPHSKFSA